MKYLAVLLLVCACQPVVNNTADTTQPVDAPIAKVKKDPGVIVKSCPEVISLTPANFSTQTDMTRWECTSNCTMVPFVEARIYVKTNLANGVVMIQEVMPNGAQQTWATNGIDRAHTLIDETGHITMNRAEFGQPATPAQYPASLDCDQLTINDAVFTYKEVIETGY